MVQISRLGLRVDPGESPDWPVLTVLIDGKDVIGEAAGFQGFDPGEMLDMQALLPTSPPRRIAVNCCSCGIAGCGSAACVISQDGAVIYWQDFRDYVGVFDAPIADVDEDDEGRKLPIPDLAFDAKQYRAEVERAHADRSWETRRRRIARLLLVRLRENDGLKKAGYRVSAVWPAWDSDGFEVSLWRSRGQTVVGVTGSARSDQDLVRDLAAQIVDRPERRWNVTFRGGR